MSYWEKPFSKEVSTIKENPQKTDVLTQSKWETKELSQDVENSIIQKNIEKNINKVSVLWAFITDNKAKIDDIITPWKKRSIELNTYNDSTGTNNLRDTGDSFWFNVRYKDDSQKVNLRYSGFTTGEIIWEYQWQKYIDTRTSTRIDSINLNYQQAILQKKYTDGSYVTVYAWGWVQAIWDFWWDNVQNKWHKAGKWYEHLGKYDPVSKVTPVLNASLEWKMNFSPLYSAQPYIKSETEIQVATNTKYAYHSIESDVKAWVEYKSVDMWGFSKLKSRSGVTASPTIQAALKDDRSVVHGVYIEYKKGDYTFWLQYGKHEITGWIKVSF